MIDSNILEKAKKWLSEEYDTETRNTVSEWIENNDDELTEAFYKDLEFGTGGLRGIMGVGTNRVNSYTIGMATQGLANYILNQCSGESVKVAIAHDSRNRSREFAQKTAEVFSANGFAVYLFDDLRPTPELSFAIRHLGCKSGVVITASHNPKEYNGYKVYWNDGGQLVPPHDKGVIEEVRKISSPSQVKMEADPDSIISIGKEVDAIYFEHIKQLSLRNSKSDLKIVYTPIHGSGVKSIPPVLKLLGYNNVTVVEEQATPDGNFPTVHSPNPEEEAALDLAIQKAKELGADIVLGTDPDADRVGAAVKNNNGEFVLLNGNQIGSLLVRYLLMQWQKQGKLTGTQFVAKTIVTTELISSIADHFNVPCYNTLTGFKYIAELIRSKEGVEQFVGGGEESYGYLIGDFVRDKDAVISSVIIAEVAADAKDQGKTLFDELIDMYKEFGFFKEHLISVTKKGKSGAEEIEALMSNLRKDTPTHLANQPIISIRDYKTGQERNLLNGEISATNLPTSNVLQFQLKDNSIVTARPSGTEPKIKFYFSVRDKLSSLDQYESISSKLDQQLKLLAKSLQELAG